MFRRCLSFRRKTRWNEGTVPLGSGKRGRPALSRQGLTLLEMLLALAILVMIAGTLGGLATAVQMNSDYGEGQGTATQHARVVLERIERSVAEAVANESFPGFLVVAQYVGTWRFPDTLVVWRPPDGARPADPEGLPRFNEVVIYCPNPRQPGQLQEIRLPNDARVVPPVENEAAWAAEIAAIQQAQTGQIVALTDRLRTCSVSGASSATPRGAVRFESRLLPSAAEWQQYRSGTLAWRKLSWVQGIYGAQTGLRQAWLRIELQLVPEGATGLGSAGQQQPVVFFGSAARYYEMHR